MAKTKATTKPTAPKAKKATGNIKTEATKKAPAQKKLSMLDAAAKILADANEPMQSKAIIEAMAEQKLWTSPNGKTPHATLYAAITREINSKGNDSRFTKADKGLFAFASK